MTTNRKIHKSEVIACPECKAEFCRLPRRGRPMLFCSKGHKDAYANARRIPRRDAHRLADAEHQAEALSMPNPGDYVSDEDFEAALYAWHSDQTFKRDRPGWFGIDLSGNGTRHSSQGSRASSLMETLDSGFLIHDGEYEPVKADYSESPDMKAHYSREGVPVSDDEGATCPGIRTIGNIDLPWNWQEAYA